MWALNFLPTLYENFLLVINHTRTVQTNHPSLAFKLSKEGVDFFNQNSFAVNEKIQQVLNTVPNTSVGIDWVTPLRRDPGGTMTAEAILGVNRGMINTWNCGRQAVPNSFFTTTTPKLATKPQ